METLIKQIELAADRLILKLKLVNQKLVSDETLTDEDSDFLNDLPRASVVDKYSNYIPYAIIEVQEGGKLIALGVDDDNFRKQFEFDISYLDTDAVKDLAAHVINAREEGL